MTVLCLTLQLSTQCEPNGHNNKKNSQNSGAQKEHYMVSLDSATVKSSGTNLSEDTKDSNMILHWISNMKLNLWKRAQRWKVSRDLFIKEQAIQKNQKKNLFTDSQCFKKMRDIDRSRASTSELDLLLGRVKYQ